MEAVQPQERVRDREADPLVAIQEGVVVGKGFHQSSGVFLEARVVTHLRPENGGHQPALVAQAMDAAEFVNQLFVELFGFGDGGIDVPGI
jgi:hypothetical protein